jgi:hypothetical protein
MSLHPTTQYRRLVTLAFTAGRSYVSLTLAISRLLCKGLRRCDQYEKRSSHHGDMCERGREDTRDFSQLILHSAMVGFYTYLEISEQLNSVCIIIIRDIVPRIACGSAKAVASDVDSVLYLTQETSVGPTNHITFCQ